MCAQPDLPESDRQLVAAAQAARLQAYAPYSKYCVGAAIRTPTGQVYTGCNVENASYGLTVCAERVALFNAVAQGERNFDTIAIITEEGGMPCGACRQVLREFAPALRVLVANREGYVREQSLLALLPEAFGPENLSS